MTPKKHFFGTFGTATQTKLQLFRKYIEAWIPVFLNKPKSGFDSIKTVVIYDFFSGPGCDDKGTPGSPLIIIDELKKYCHVHSEKKSCQKKIRVVFNDKNPQAIAVLEQNYAINRCNNACCTVEIHKRDFREMFYAELPNMKKKEQASLVLMDQFGLKDVDPEIISHLASASKTDFIFFISSSQARRFSRQKGIVERFPDLTKIPPDLCHKSICDFFMAKINNNQSKCRLIPFSLKKRSNVYGIIFGSGHALGIEKFLTACWNTNPINGEANYDIENDGDVTFGGQGSLFDYANGEDRDQFKPKKKTRFKKQLLNYIREHHENPVTNIDIYNFTIDSGFSPDYTREILKEAIKSNQILVFKSPSNEPTKDIYLRYNPEQTVYFVWNNAPVQASLF